VRELGERLLEGLRELPGVLSARGRGLMVAAEIGGEAPDVARRALLEQRLIINATGPTTLRFLPPLIVSAGEVDEALARLRPLLA
jgi:acetylornithine/succinyldiaminopimelate/putrescine aminotransferase